MAGAIAGAHYGIEAAPQSWIWCSEGAEDADVAAERLHMLYHQSPRGGESDKGEKSGPGTSDGQSMLNGRERKSGTE